MSNIITRCKEHHDKVENTERMIPVECFTRICGYFRPIKQANPGKTAEIMDRRPMPTKNLKKYLT